MSLTIQLASNDKTIEEETKQHLKDYKSQSLLTQTRGGEEVVAMLPATEKW